MTMPDERTRAVINTRKFLSDLLNSKATPKVPKEIREKAYRLLKHYPTAFYIKMAASGDLEVFDKTEATRLTDEETKQFSIDYSTKLERGYKKAKK